MTDVATRAEIERQHKREGLGDSVWRTAIDVSEKLVDASGALSDFVSNLRMARQAGLHGVDAMVEPAMAALSTVNALLDANWELQWRADDIRGATRRASMRD